MPPPEWRSFPFLHRELVVDAHDPTRPPAWLLEMDVTVIAGGRGSLFFGDAAGGISIVNHGLAVVFSFQAFEGSVTHLKVMRNRNILVAVGDDEGGIPVLKLWNLDKLDKESKVPSLIRSSKVQHNNKIFPVTALAVLENMSQVAIGLENGVVLLIRGDISRDRFTKTKAVYESGEPVTGLGFYEDGKSSLLYIVTLARILICNTSNKDAM
ncbi:Vacuolar protein sorting-associated protein 11, partial [Cladochytrium tenue]